MRETVKAAIVQDAAVPMAVGDAIERAVQLAKVAIETGAKVIAFGEHFLGGSPAWLEHVPGSALWDHPGTRELQALLLAHAVRGKDPRLAPMQLAVDIAGVVVSVGGIERLRRSLYSTQFLFRPKAPPLLHRKLLLSPAERMLFGSGDGSTLEAHESPWGAIGQLAGSEHWMPLARAAMHHAGERIHVAAWPAMDDLGLLAATHYAVEGRCFVLAAGTIQTRAGLLAGYERVGGDGAARKLIDRLPDTTHAGRSGIIAPDGVMIAHAGEEPVILTAELNLGDIDRGPAGYDADGQHARPDVFELRVERRPRTGIVDVADEEGGAETRAA